MTKVGKNDMTKMNKEIVREEIGRVMEEVREQNRNDVREKFGIARGKVSKGDEVIVLMVLQSKGYKIKVLRGYYAIELGKDFKTSVALIPELEELADEVPSVEELRRESKAYMREIVSEEMERIEIELYNYIQLGEDEAYIKKIENDDELNRVLSYEIKGMYSEVEVTDEYWIIKLEK